MAKGFSEVLAQFADAGRATEIKESSRVTIEPGDYHVQVVGAQMDAKANQYGPYVDARLRFAVVDAGEWQGHEFTMPYLISKTKDGKLSFGGQDFVKLAGVLAGERIQDNNPQLAAQIVERSAAKKDRDILKVRLFKRKNGYLGIDALSLESSGK